MATQMDQDVPGTVLLVDLAGGQSDGKHASDRSDIVLVPQPSADPEDPLNWSRKRKMWSLAMVFVYTMGVGIPGTLHYSVIADISNDTGIPTVDLGAYLVIDVGSLRMLTHQSQWQRRYVSLRQVYPISRIENSWLKFLAND